MSETIHTRIKAHRLRLKLSKAAFGARVAKEEGLARPISYQTVQQWENGKTAPKRKRLLAVAKACGVKPQELMFGDKTSQDTLAVPDDKRFRDLTRLWPYLGSDEQKQEVLDVAFRLAWPELQQAHEVLKLVSSKSANTKSVEDALKRKPTKIK